MILKFYAKTGNTVPVPGRKRATGQFTPYVGRQVVAVPGRSPKLVATREPYEVDTDKVDPKVVEQYRLALTRDNGIWCSDKETAAYFGVQFVELTYKEPADKDPYWEPVAPKQDKPKKNEGNLS